MGDENDITLQAYEEHIQDYTSEQLGDGLKGWIDSVLKLVPKDGTILELGSGDGRDAAYITSRGYKIIATDAAQGFVELLKRRGLEARKLNAITDDLGKGYDLVFAQAVFLHFTPEQLRQVLHKVYRCLKPGAFLAFSVKKGHGVRWSDDYLGAPRYYYFWEASDLRELVEQVGFTIYEITERADSRSVPLIQVIAKK